MQNSHEGRQMSPEIDQLTKGYISCREKIKIIAGLKKRQREMTFDCFDVMYGQHEAYENCMAYANGWTKKTENGLLLMGPIGCGKTHLVAAMCNLIIDRFPINEQLASEALYNDVDWVKPGIKFTSCIDLLGLIKVSFKNDDNGAKILDIYKNAPLLILDDLGPEQHTEWVRERYFEIVDHRYNEKLPIIITTNLILPELREIYGVRIMDRLCSMCKTIAITTPSQRVSL